MIKKGKLFEVKYLIWDKLIRIISLLEEIKAF